MSQHIDAVAKQSGLEALNSNLESKRTFSTGSIVITQVTDLIDPNSPPQGLSIGCTIMDFDDYPSEVGGNSGIIISRAQYTGNSVIYGMQIFMSFGTNKIATRNHPYGAERQWGSWAVK